MEKKNIAREKQTGKKKRTWLKILLVILIIIAAASIYFVYKINKNGGGMQGMIATLVGHDAETLKDLEPLYFLILGESVSGDSRLTDTIVACKYDPKTQTAAMLSIPRDTYTGTDRSRASAYYKINNAYRGGEDPENAVEAVNKITGLDIEYYVWVNTNVLKEIVDEIGGVYFDVPMRMLYRDTSQNLDIDLQEGYQLLNGDQAEQVVRFRHNDERLNWTTYPPEYGIEDYGRMRTQREFISATLQQTLKPENILKIGGFIDIAYRNIKTNMPLDVIKDYLPYAVNFSTENLQTETLPGSDQYVETTGTYMFFHNTQKTEELVNRIFLNPTLQEDEENANNVKETNNIIEE